MRGGGIVAATIAAGVLGAGAAVVVVAREEHPLLSLAARWQGARFEGMGSGVRQQRANDCGPAALAHCLRRLGVPVPYPDAESTIPLGRGGCSFAALAVEAARWGRQASIRRIDPGDLGEVRPPAILYLRRRHFVVYEGRDPEGRVVVHDPALGRLSYPPQGLGRHWGGEVLSFRSREREGPDEERTREQVGEEVGGDRRAGPVSEGGAG